MRYASRPLQRGRTCCHAGAHFASTSGADSSRAVSVKVGKLNLVDLAGSERVSITGATGAVCQ